MVGSRRKISVVVGSREDEEKERFQIMRRRSKEGRKKKNEKSKIIRPAGLVQAHLVEVRAHQSKENFWKTSSAGAP